MLTSAKSEELEPLQNAVMKGWTAETKRAIEAVTFIAAHLKNEDDYAEVILVIIAVYCPVIYCNKLFICQ